MVNPFASILPNIRAFGKNRWALLFLVLSLGVNAAIWAAIYRFAQSSEDFVPLHYSTAIGIDRIGQWQQLLIMPAIGLGAIVVSFILAIFTRRERVLPDLVLGCAFAVQVILVMACIFLLYNFF